MWKGPKTFDTSIAIIANSVCLSKIRIVTWQQYWSNALYTIYNIVKTMKILMLNVYKFCTTTFCLSSLLSRQTFDVFKDGGADTAEQALLNFVALQPNGSIVMMAVYDSANPCNSNCQRAMLLVGGTGQAIGFRGNTTSSNFRFLPPAYADI